jgi:hypothetical protein
LLVTENLVFVCEPCFQTLMLINHDHLTSRCFVDDEVTMTLCVAGAMPEMEWVTTEECRSRVFSSNALSK